MDVNLVKEIFEKSKLTQNPIGIWTYTDDEGFWSGYVIDYNEDFVQIQHYTKYGKLDGTLIEQIANIERIDFEDDYLRCLKYLIDNSQELDKENEFKQSLPAYKNWQFNYLNHHAGKVDSIIGITVKDDITYSGMIDKIDTENIILKIIGKLGDDEGFSMFKLEDISCVRVNDIENRKRLMLFNWKRDSLKSGLSK